MVGELHHPTAATESERPSWLVIPEKGLYTGVLIVGAVGTGKTMACMYPFAQQLLSFATVGQDDPSGDEKAFALTRQCRCIPIVATQSISSLRSVLPSGEAWRTLVQTLRTRIFLSLSDESSARIASEMCGSVMKTQASHTFTETTGRPEFSLLSGRAGGGPGTIGTSKSFRQALQPVFTPWQFTLLANYQAICLPYDGVKPLAARRVYLKPHYLPRTEGYWRQREEGRI